MATPLKRLLPYHDRYKLPFWGGMCGLLAARLFEAAIPLFLRDGIDHVVSGSASIAAGSITSKPREPRSHGRHSRSCFACSVSSRVS